MSDSYAGSMSEALHQAAGDVAKRFGVETCDDCHMPSPHHLDVCKYVRQHTENRIAKAVADATGWLPTEPWEPE